MSESLISAMVFIGIVVVLVGGILYAIADKSRTKRSTGFASLTAFHDFQGKDKQNAIETVIEKQAEKKWEDDESGEGAHSGAEERH